VVYDEANGWQHADGSVSHGDGESVSDKMTAVAKSAGPDPALAAEVQKRRRELADVERLMKESPGGRRTRVRHRTGNDGPRGTDVTKAGGTDPKASGPGGR
jgi:hypothetical protein